MAMNTMWKNCTLLWLFMGCLYGCATSSTAHRFYSDSPLPENEAAFVYAVNGCKISEVRNHTEEETKHIDLIHNAATGLLDLFPGEYTLGIFYSHFSDNFDKRIHDYGEKISIPFDAQPGRIYVIYPSIDDNNLWKPVIVTIDDYEAEECRKNSHLSCPDKDRIRKKIDAYLQSERPVMRFHPLSETPYYKPVTEEAKRNIKGFWW